MLANVMFSQEFVKRVSGSGVSMCGLYPPKKNIPFFPLDTFTWSFKESEYFMCMY